MEREKPFVAKLNFPVVDVRDVAAAHVKAMTSDDAAGKTRRSNKQDHPVSLSLSLSLWLWKEIQIRMIYHMLVIRDFVF